MTTQQQITMFGMTTEEIMQRIPEHARDYVGDLNMYAMGLLSDAQEMIARGQDEAARQTLNRAKYIMSEYHAQLRNLKVED